MICIDLNVLLYAVDEESARHAAARMINADPNDVALISSVSYGVATAAKVLTVPAGSRVLRLENDHCSAVLEWLTRAAAQGLIVDVVPQPDDGDWTAAVLAAIMSAVGDDVFRRCPVTPDMILASLEAGHRTHDVLTAYI